MKLICKPARPVWLPTVSFALGVAVTPERWKIYLKLDSNLKMPYDLDSDDDES